MTDAALPTQAINVTWECNRSVGLSEQAVIHVPAGATDKAIAEIVEQYVMDDAGFSWGWERA